MYNQIIIFKLYLYLFFGIGSKSNLWDMLFWPYHTNFWSIPLQALLLIASAYFIYISLH